MSAERKATKTVPSKFADRFSGFPSAGPYPNVSGMKKLYWGVGACCIRCGVYVYHVSRTTWEKY